MLEGVLAAHPRHLRRAEGSARAILARDGPRPGKVGLVIGGGSGHMGRGLADAAAIGNVFASPPPDPILACTRAASGGAGVLSPATAILSHLRWFRPRRSCPSLLGAHGTSVAAFGVGSECPQVVWRTIMRCTRGPSGPRCRARRRSPTKLSAWVARWLWRTYSTQVGVW